MSEYFRVLLMLDGTAQITYAGKTVSVQGLKNEDLVSWSKSFNGAFPWIMYEQETR